jgi:hypothetical protein
MQRLMDARLGNRGKLEFTQVLRLMEAIQLGAIGFGAVKQIALARVKRSPPRLGSSA